MIKFILIDLDDTILDFRLAEHTALKLTLSEFGIKNDGEMLSDYSKINIAQWQRLERGELTREQVKTERYRLLFEKYGITSVTPAEMTARYESNLAIGHFFVDGAENLLKSLSNNYRLFLVSNGARDVQLSRIGSSGIAPYFERIFISEDIGFVKPDVRFFENAAAQIDGFSKDSAVILGDSLTADVKGGINFGIMTVWFNKYGAEFTGAIVPDFTVNSLSEVNDIIKKM